MLWTERTPQPRIAHQLEQLGVEPLLAKLFAMRGVSSAADLQTELSGLLPLHSMLHLLPAAQFLADQIQANRRIVIVADYDCDGATACAVGLRALRMLGCKNLSFVVPDRISMGYGLSPAVVDLAIDEYRPDVLITVDNGIASVEGVAYANQRGLQVLVTDHHLAGEQLPDAAFIVNPNQPGCGFASKNLAGVGVIFYLMLATRAALRERGVFDAASQPKFDKLLDLLALGTVADVVKLDSNNRLLVSQGLRRIRQGQAQAGVQALLRVAGRNASQASCKDLGFTVGPRINAAGRMDDMRVGILCLTTDDPVRANEYAQMLQDFNLQRRDVEHDILDSAMRLVQDQPLSNASSCCLYRPDWHEGVIGIVASRLKDQQHLPTFIFTNAQDGSLKGSGRSIAGFHLRDALDWVSKQQPDLLHRFGGHAMAAGCSLASGGFERFQQLFNQVAEQWLDAATRARKLTVDGPLEPKLYHANTALQLEQQVWGNGFAEPIFSDEYQLLNQQILKDRHLKASVRIQGQARQLLCWNRTEALPSQGRIAYHLSSDNFQGIQQVKMVLADVQEN